MSRPVRQIELNGTGSRELWKAYLSRCTFCFIILLGRLLTKQVFIKLPRNLACLLCTLSIMYCRCRRKEIACSRFLPCIPKQLAQRKKSNELKKSGSVFWSPRPSVGREEKELGECYSFLAVLVFAPLPPIVD